MWRYRARPAPSSPTKTCGDVHAHCGSTVDRAVARELHELLALGLSPTQLGEHALGGLLEPDPAVVVLADDQVGDLRGVGADVAGASMRCGLGRRRRERRQLDAGELAQHVPDEVAVERRTRRRRWSAARPRPRARGRPAGTPPARWCRRRGRSTGAARRRQSNSSQPRPQASPIRPRSGSVDLAARCIALTLARAQHRVPSAAAPPSQVHLREGQQVARAHREHRAGRGVGARQRPDRGRAAGRRPGVGWTWPTAARNRIASLASGGGVGEAERREQVLAQAVVERLAAQHLDQPAEHAEAGVVVGEPLAGREELGHRRAASATYFSTQSSPGPVSVKMSPSKPAVWHSSWRAVIAAAAASSAMHELGQVAGAPARRGRAGPRRPAA